MVGTIILYFTGFKIITTWNKLLHKMGSITCNEAESLSSDALQGREITHSFEYSLESKETLSECNHIVTEVFKPTSYWLWAENDKYKHLELDPHKIGKWMLFVKKGKVDVAWEKIKNAIKSGDLWHSKVSAGDESSRHVIIVYTKDYTDIDDVVNCLKFLEQSGLKPPNQVIKYKTDDQTRAGVYSANKQKASIYSSDTIRNGRMDQLLSWRLKKD